MVGRSTISREGLLEYPIVLDLEDEDSAVQRADTEKALNFVRALGWGAPVRRLSLVWGVGGLITVFSVIFDRNAIGPPNGLIWVVVGDVPSAYVVYDWVGGPLDSIEPYRWSAVAAEGYCQRMDAWIAAVHSGIVPDMPLAGLEPTQANADKLEAKIKFIREELLAADPLEFLGGIEGEHDLVADSAWPR